MTHHRLDFLDRPDPQYLDPEAEEGSPIRLRSMAERAALLPSTSGASSSWTPRWASLYTPGDLELDESDEDE